VDRLDPERSVCLGEIPRRGCPGLFVSPSLASAQGALPTDTMSRLAYFSPQRAFALSPDGKAAEARLSMLEAAKARRSPLAMRS
jgi:hypothetical protein